jgi:hypothetical protein
MPFDLLLPRSLRNSGWRVTIHDFERLEEPHVTIYRKLRAWRLSLRTGRFLDRGDKYSQIAKAVRQAIRAEWPALQAQWNLIHPDNPVRGIE